MARVGRAMDTLLQDLRFAVRTLSKSRLFTLVAVVSLAIGIGANTAVYALVETLFLRAPAGVARADELVAFHQVEPRQGGQIWWEFSSYSDYVHYRDHGTVFSGLSSHFGFTGIDSTAATEIPGSVVSASYFSVLGVAPQLGRFFQAEEDAVPDRNFVVVLSHSFLAAAIRGRSAMPRPVVQAQRRAAHHRGSRTSGVSGSGRGPLGRRLDPQHDRACRVSPDGHPGTGQERRPKSTAAGGSFEATANDRQRESGADGAGAAASRRPSRSTSLVRSLALSAERRAPAVAA